MKPVGRRDSHQKPKFDAHASASRCIPVPLEKIGTAWGEEPHPFRKPRATPSVGSRYVLVPNPSKKPRRGGPR